MIHKWVCRETRQEETHLENAQKSLWLLNNPWTWKVLLRDDRIQAEGFWVCQQLLKGLNRQVRYPAIGKETLELLEWKGRLARHGEWTSIQTFFSFLQHPDSL